MAVAQWSVVCVGNVLVANVLKQGAGTYKFHLPYAFVPFHLAYAYVITMGATYQHGAFCSSDIVYPKILWSADVVFILFWIFVLICHFNKYFIIWQPKIETAKGNPIPLEKAQRRLNKVKMMVQ